MAKDSNQIYYVKEQGREVSAETEKVSAKVNLKMEWNDEEGCVVSGALALVLLMSRYCGLAPLSFQRRDDGWYITLSAGAFFVSCILSIVLCVVTVISVVLDLSVENSRSVRVSTGMTAAVFITELVFVNVTVLVGVFGAPARMRHMINIKKSIAKEHIFIFIEIQPATCDHGKFWDKKTSAIIILFIFAAFFLLGCDYCLNINRAIDYNKDRTVAYLYTSFFIQYAITFFLQLQFILVAMAIESSLKAMNDGFEDISQNLYIRALHESLVRSSNVMEKTMYQPLESVNLLVDSLNTGKVKNRSALMGSIQLSVQPHETISRFASLHCLLCDLVQQMNSSYGFILIVLLLSFLIHLIMSPYYLILQLQDSQRRTYKLCLQFLWCIFHTTNMFMLVEPCHRTIKEFERTQELVSRLIRRLRSNSGQLAVQLELFSRQLLLRAVHYAPLGMCKLDRPLITSIIGGVTTYLVILIQFQKFSEFNATGNV